MRQLLAVELFVVLFAFGCSDAKGAPNDPSAVNAKKGSDASAGNAPSRDGAANVHGDGAVVAPSDGGGGRALSDGGGQHAPGLTPDGAVAATDSGQPDPDAGTCATPTAFQLLVVFDESASMQELWGTTNRLDGARTAVHAALADRTDILTVGALFFPTTQCIPGLPPAAGGAVAAFDASPHIGFRPGPAFLTAWDAHFAGTPSQSIGTPLQEAFDRADVALASLSDPSATRTAILLITDGAPNCVPDPALTGTPTAESAVRTADWLARGISTHVVDLGPMPADALAAIAAAGGTTPVMPADPSALQAAIARIIAREACI